MSEKPITTLDRGLALLGSAAMMAKSAQFHQELDAETIKLIVGIARIAADLIEEGAKDGHP